MIPLFFNGRSIGIFGETAAKNARFAPQVFRENETGFHLVATTPEAASKSLDALMKTWFDRGILKRWRGEKLDVLDPKTGEAIFPLEREGRVPLGLTMTGALLNAVVLKEGALYLWVAQRATNKSIEPLKWDCLANGAVGAGETPAHALAREAWEEAGIPQELAIKAHAAAQLTITHQDGEFIFFERAHCFDLIVPESFQPENNDGEVEQFACVSIARLHEMLREKLFTLDARLAIENWLERNQG